MCWPLEIGQADCRDQVESTFQVKDGVRVKGRRQDTQSHIQHLQEGLEVYRVPGRGPGRPSVHTVAPSEENHLPTGPLRSPPSHSTTTEDCDQEGI